MKIQTVVVGKLLNNTYIVTSEKGNAIIIDPGMEFDKIEAALSASGACLKYIIFTHGHYDHTASAYDLVEKTGAKLVIGSRDAEMLEDTDKSMSWMFTNHPHTLKADIEVEDGDTLSLDELEFKFVLTPGHSKGSMVILCEDVMFSGDTVLERSVGRTDFYGGNEAFMIQSIKKLAALSKNYRILAGHGDATTLEDEKQHNPYFIEYA
ncbi:MAG: MBL fold metallo-hydrolase [Oscillospiraceae bacterium]|nr:MBL fold metallo-hydrolase [Oscillospiraceae bacterium]